MITLDPSGLSEEQIDLLLSRCAACDAVDRRVYWNTLFRVALCDECVLRFPPVDGHGREVRVRTFSSPI